MKKHLIAFLAIILFTPVYSQSLEETLQSLSLDAAKMYTDPAISAFGSNLNSGWVTSVPENTLMKFNVEVKFTAQASFFKNNDQNFSTNGNFRFTEQQARDIVNNSQPDAPENVKNQLIQQILQDNFTVNISGPTIIGDKNKEVLVQFPGKTYEANGGTQYTIAPFSVKTGAKGFLNKLSLLPAGAVQLNVGTLYGTNLSVRFLPSVNIQDIGDFSFWGVGVLHNPAPYLPVNFLPIDLAVGVFYQHMKAGDIFESNALQYGIFASKTIGDKYVAFIPYAGLTMESSTTTLTYEYEFDTSIGSRINLRQSIDLDANNTAGLTLGAKFKISFFNIFADYKIAKTGTLNGGISFTF